MNKKHVQDKIVVIGVGTTVDAEACERAVAEKFISEAGEPAPKYELRLPWGLSPIAEVDPGTLAWGARAILERGRLDFLSDRCGWANRETHSTEEILVMGKWINKHTAQIDATQIDPASEEVTTVVAGDYCMKYSAKGSHGYVYITVWKLE